MRVCFVSNVVYPFVTGGAQKRIYEIGTRLANEGHEVTIYGRKFWDGPDETTHEGMKLRSVAPEADLYADDRRSITEAIDFATRLAYPLRRRLSKGDHDIVVTSVFPYFPVLASKLASIGSDVPVVTTWHEVWRDYWDEYLGPLGPCGKLVEYTTARTPQHPIAVSERTADRLTEVGPRRDDIAVVPNGIDIEQIQAAPLPEDRGAERYDIVFAGRLIENKNVALLLEAFDAVAADHDATLGIIGEGPELDRLKRRTATLNHADRVTFLGFLDEYEDVLGHMRAANVFASPSTREGFGITYAEAMAAGCTVIGADHPESAASEVLGEAGYLTKPTVDDLTATLDRSLSGDTPAKDPQERAQRFDWDSVAEQAESTYKRAVHGAW